MTLDDWMKAQGLKDADVAARVAGLSRSQVCRLRNRTSIPSPKTARKLEVLTGIPAEKLIFAERRAA